jgi:ERCC4-related helicase
VNWRLLPEVQLRNERIANEDADRQRRTAAEILRRFDRWPGIVLADEVGLGKTYVALAVAVSVAARPDNEGPVVVMVPSSVGPKWPREWDTFKEKCLRDGPEVRATPETITSGSDFFKLLDDPVSRSHDIVFLSHRALTASLKDPLVQLAIVRKALSRPSLRAQRAAFPRWASRVLRSGNALREPVVAALMQTPPRRWGRAWASATDEPLDDDPVPEAILDALDRIDLSTLVEACRGIPLRTSPRLTERLRDVGIELRRAVNAVWAEGLRLADLHLPLLILDEAHHAKNPGTMLAKLFSDSADRDEAELLSGPLADVFDRMLFLTATPLQLAHRELIEVLRRFEGIRWRDLDRVAYAKQIDNLEQALDSTQAASLRLDRVWGSLAPKELADAPGEWWERPKGVELPPTLAAVADHVSEVRRRVGAAERLLRPLVIRHSRSGRDNRRQVLSGRAISDPTDPGRRGLGIEGSATLPFLLAARAQSLVLAEGRRGGKRGRALFAEGLASSFEAYAKTRTCEPGEDVIDDAKRGPVAAHTQEIEWYLKQIELALPSEDQGVWSEHPKISATVNRAVELWQADEKVLVFCFYRATGRALREHISRRLDQVILEQARRQLGGATGTVEDVRKALDLRSDRFFDPDAPVTKIANRELRAALRGRVEEERRGEWVAVMLRFLRTPSFIVRHIGLKGSAADAFLRALREPDRTGRSLRQRLHAFAAFLADRTPGERAELLSHLQKLESGIRARDGERQLPNVRLANGELDAVTRERLLRGFNSPFLPEILIASSVMAEGVDLHLNCRHVIHHDLDWNPSVIEQRTGRLDRLGSLAEERGEPVVIFEPFLEATQDEKIFRVMKDRERWFNVVMGEQLTLDEWSTETLSKRQSLPSELASELALNLALRS